MFDDPTHDPERDACPCDACRAERRVIVEGTLADIRQRLEREVSSSVREWPGAARFTAEAEAALFAEALAWEASGDNSAPGRIDRRVRALARAWVAAEAAYERSA